MALIRSFPQNRREQKGSKINKTKGHRGMEEERDRRERLEKGKKTICLLDLGIKYIISLNSLFKN